MSLFEITILDVIFSWGNATSDEFDVVDLRSIRISSSLSDKMEGIFTFFSSKIVFSAVEFVIFGKVAFDDFSIENNFESVTVLFPKSISGSMIES